MLKSLNLTCPINTLGYGCVGTNLFKEFCAASVDVKLWPIGQVDCHPSLMPLVQRAYNEKHNYYPRAPSLRIWHQHDLAQHVGRGVHVGYPIFELDRFTQAEKNEVSVMDVVLVCSQWAKTVVLDNCPLGGKQVEVVPLGVDREIFNEQVGEPDPSWTTFLNVGKWEYRKGHDIIAEAFSKAFNPKDRVRLWMMNHNPFISEEDDKAWQNMYRNTEMGHRINFLPRVQSHKEVAKVMAEADCGVFPARGEGWNLELLEMMSMGKQVIATDYSAHTEFCNENNCYLIPITDTEEAYDGVFFKGQHEGGRWAALGNEQIDCLVSHMRAVHDNKQENVAGIKTAQKLTWKFAAQTILGSSEIWG